MFFNRVLIICGIFVQATLPKHYQISFKLIKFAFFLFNSYTWGITPQLCEPELVWKPRVYKCEWERWQWDQWATGGASSLKGKVGLEARVTLLLLERGREKEGRLDSIKPKPAGEKTVWDTSPASSSGDIFYQLLKKRKKAPSTWFKGRGACSVPRSRLLECFSSLWRWVDTFKCSVFKAWLARRCCGI